MIDLSRYLQTLLSAPAPQRFLNRAALAEKLGVGASKAGDLTRRPDFPRPTYECGDARWLEIEVDAWMLDQVIRERTGRS